MHQLTGSSCCSGRHQRPLCRHSSTLRGTAQAGHHFSKMVLLCHWPGAQAPWQQQASHGRHHVPLAALPLLPLISVAAANTGTCPLHSVPLLADRLPSCVQLEEGVGLLEDALAISLQPVLADLPFSAAGQ